MWFGVSGWFGGSGLFFVVCFFEMEKDPMWVLLSHLLMFVHGLLERGGHFF